MLSSRARRMLEAEIEQLREDEEATCISSPFNIAHMQLLNSTFIKFDVRVDWSPEDRDGFSTRKSSTTSSGIGSRQHIRPPALKHARKSSFTSTSNKNSHHLRSVTPRPRHVFSIPQTLPVHALHTDDNIPESSSSSQAPKGSTTTSGRAVKQQRRSRRDSSPACPAFTPAPTFLISSASDDDESDLDDPFAPSFSLCDPFAAAALSSSSISRRRANDTAPYASRGRTRETCPVGLQFSSRAAYTEGGGEDSSSSSDEEWIEHARRR